MAEAHLWQQDFELLGEWVRFTLAYNENLALSIPFPLIAQIILSVILLGVLIFYFWKSHPPKTYWDIGAVAMIFGGALGNLIDRMLFARVVDFIAVWQFPIFNLADTFLFLGVVFLVGKEMLKKDFSK